MARPKIFDAFDHPPKVLLEDFGPSLTKQSEAAACDINNIVKQFSVTGMLPQYPGNPLYLDVSAMGDYQAALEQVRVADGFFMQLPAKIRERFQNSASHFLDFVSDPQNRLEMEELGLIEKAVKPPDPAPPVV